MKQTKSYVDMLINALEKKRTALISLDKLEIQQEKIFSEKKISAEEVSRILDEKKKHIDKLEELDLGFEKLYERVKMDIKEDKAAYKKDIIKMQDLIRDISALTVKLQATQSRNKERYEALFNNKKQEIKQFKRSNMTVSNYYKNMYNSHQEGSSYFLDKKK